MAEKSHNVMGDFDELKGYLLGTLALGTAVTTFLVNAFHTPLDITLIGVVGVCFFFLVIVYMIQQAENRANKTVQAHKASSDAMIAEFRKDIKILKDRTLENQRSGLRAEMDNEMYRNPSNHDTIIRYAYKYFYELNGDWVQTDKFLTWVEKEREAGRPVHLSPELAQSLHQKGEQERLERNA